MNKFLKMVRIIEILFLCCVGGVLIVGLAPVFQCRRSMSDAELQKVMEEHRAYVEIMKKKYPAKYSLAQFNQIQNGMTFDQVSTIIGESITARTMKTAVYEWNNFEDGGFNVKFQDGKVIEKWQFELK